MRNKLFLLNLAVLAFLPTFLPANSTQKVPELVSPSCPEFDAVTKELNESYSQSQKQELSDLQKKEGKERTAKDAEIDNTGDQYKLLWSYETTSTSLDVPTVTIKDTTAKISLPQTSLADGSVTLDVPGICDKIEKVGQYPEFKCDDWKCKTVWTDIKTKVFYPCIERKELKFKKPVFSFEIAQISVPEPTITFERMEIKIDLPQVTQKSPKDRIEDRKGDLGLIFQKYSGLRNELTKTNVNNRTSDLSALYVSHYTCKRADLQTKRAATLIGLADAIRMYDTILVNRYYQTLKADGSPGHKRALEGINSFFKRFKIDQTNFAASRTRNFDSLIRQLKSQTSPLLRKTFAIDVHSVSERIEFNERRSQFETWMKAMNAVGQSFREMDKVFVDSDASGVYKEHLSLIPILDNRDALFSRLISYSDGSMKLAEKTFVRQEELLASLQKMRADAVANLD